MGMEEISGGMVRTAIAGEGSLLQYFYTNSNNGLMFGSTQFNLNLFTVSSKNIAQRVDNGGVGQEEALNRRILLLPNRTSSVEICCSFVSNIQYLCSNKLKFCYFYLVKTALVTLNCILLFTSTIVFRMTYWGLYVLQNIRG